MSIFYTEVPKSVQDALSSRKRYYGSTDRDTNAHAWLYRKTANVEVSAYNPKTKKGKSLENPVGGGLDGNSLYTSNNDARFIPKPHLNSVKISSDGDFGSLKKCEVAFTVHSVTDLNNCQPFFDIGADVVINYGWSITSPGAGSNGKFEGIIYNFSYTVNESGGFDCITYGIAKGVSVLPINITAGTPVDSMTSDSLDKTKVAVNILDVLRKNSNLLTESKTVDRYGFGKDEIIDTPSGTSSIKSAERAYITLEKLIDLVNNNLLIELIDDVLNDDFKVELNNLATVSNNNTGGVSVGLQPGASISGGQGANPTTGVRQSTKRVEEKDFLIVCNSTYTRGLIPERTTDLISANPLQVIFPGFSTYGSKTYFQNAVEEIKQFKSGDISKILLSIDWLATLFETIGLETQDRQKSADQSITKFLINIFNAISDNSGTRFKLSMTSLPDNDSKFVISDINYIDKKITPYTLTAVNKQGICRRISLTSKVPSAMATVAFVSGRSSSTTQSTVAGAVLNNLSVSENSQKLLSYRQSLEKLINAAAESRYDANDVNSLRTALKNVYENASQVNKQLGGQSSIPYPIDFSATLDGIEGFQFGNTITTNYLPAVYQNGRVAFTVTKVEHTIQNNDWITTLSTVCRLIPEATNETFVYAYEDVNTAPVSVGTYGVTPTVTQ